MQTRRFLLALAGGGCYLKLGAKSFEKQGYVPLVLFCQPLWHLGMNTLGLDAVVCHILCSVDPLHSKAEAPGCIPIGGTAASRGSLLHVSHLRLSCFISLGCLKSKNLLGGRGGLPLPPPPPPPRGCCWLGYNHGNGLHLQRFGHLIAFASKFGPGMSSVPLRAGKGLVRDF